MVLSSPLVRQPVICPAPILVIYRSRQGLLPGRRSGSRRDTRLTFSHDRREPLGVYFMATIATDYTPNRPLVTSQAESKRRALG